MADILTTQKKCDHPIWVGRAELLPGYEEYFEYSYLQRRNKTMWRDIYWGVKLFFISKRYKAVVTGSERLSFIFALLQHFRKVKVPHIFIQSMWNFPKDRSALRWKTILWRAVVRSATKILVFESRQTRMYAQALRVQEEKFHFVRSHTSLYDKTYVCIDGNYIFSGGNTNRDYNTLIEAARKLPYKFVVVTREAKQLAGQIAIPENVTLKDSMRGDDFNKLIAEASVVVVPLKGGQIETGGRLVYQNAMALGKPVIVGDDSGACDYIRDGFDGYVVKSGDVEALRSSIDLLMKNRELAKTIGKNAEERAKAFSPEVFFREVFSLVDSVSESKALQKDNRAG